MPLYIPPSISFPSIALPSLPTKPSLSSPPSPISPLRLSNRRSSRSSLFTIAVLLLLSSATHCFYLPGVAPAISTLLGTADRGIKAWNVDTKRVVYDLQTSEEFPSVLDIKCSLVEPIFVSAAASKGHGSSYVDSLGFASLTVWNMKTWKAMVRGHATNGLKTLAHNAAVTIVDWHPTYPFS